MRWSQVVWGFILGKVCGETESEVVIPACDPAAQIRDPRFVKPVFREVVVPAFRVIPGF